MYKVIVFILLSFISSYSACRSATEALTMTVAQSGFTNNACYIGPCSQSQGSPCNNSPICSQDVGYVGYPYYMWLSDCDHCQAQQNNGVCTSRMNTDLVLNRCRLRCDDERSADSAACLVNGNQWINGSCCDERCVCENDGGYWNEQTNSCSPPCNDFANPHQECVQTWDNGYGECDGFNCFGGGYWKINIYQCYFDSCAMAKVCTEGSSFPAGNLTCEDWQDQDTTSQENCAAAIGHECVITCPDKRTITCDCDGSCSHAKTLPSCQCPKSSASASSSSSASSSPSSSPSSSNSAESSNSGLSSSNNDNPLFSSGSGGNGLDNALLGQIEYNTRKTKENTLASAGYLSSIDRWQSIHNANMITQQKTLEALKSEVSEASEANKAQTDTIHNSNVILSGIANVINDTISYFDNLISWNDSAKLITDSLKNHASRGVDTLSVDSLKSDTSQYKSKFSGLFLSNSQTRNGCYEFKMKKPTGSGSFGQKMKDVVIDFGNVGGIFDMCSIGRGLVRVCGAILVIMTMIISYKMAFRGGE